MWTVVILEKPKQNDFRPDFFPRRVRYKKQALELVKEVEQKGGKAQIVKGM